MTSDDRPRVLCVDDEQNVLDGLQRQLRRHFELVTESQPMRALELVDGEAPFAVVLSDLRMPEMDGIAFLNRMMTVSKDTVRVLLTGNADLDAAISAVNEGSVFRFLRKPCPPELLVGALTAAAEQHRLITSERVLLEQTLHGSIQTLCDILELANPTVFGRGLRVKQCVSEILDHFELENRWSLEVAAMLSQIGYVALPPQTAEKLYQGKRLTDQEQEITDRLPEVVENLLRNIPRIESVRDILLWQSKRFDGGGGPNKAMPKHGVPWGARALRLAVDLEALISEGSSPADAIATMRGRSGWYDPQILEALASGREAAAQEDEPAEVALAELEVGMTLTSDVYSASGTKIVAAGRELSVALLERIRNFATTQGIREPISVVTRRHQGEDITALGKRAAAS